MLLCAHGSPISHPLALPPPPLPRVAAARPSGPGACPGTRLAAPVDPDFVLASLRCLQDYPLQPLVDDCRLLGSLLDDCLRIEVGDELFNKVRTSGASWMLGIAHERLARARPGNRSQCAAACPQLAWDPTVGAAAGRCCGSVSLVQGACAAARRV